MKRTITRAVRFTPIEAQAAAAVAERQALTLSGLIRRALAQYVAEHSGDRRRQHNLKRGGAE